MISRFHIWWLRRIFRQIVCQGPHHQGNIAHVYLLLRQACRREFYEDNDPTLNEFLLEQFERSTPGKEAKP